MRLSAARPLLLATSLAVGAVLAGCDANDPPPAPAALTFEVDFRMDEAALAGSFASVAFDAPELSPRVVRDGAVLAYYREERTWTALPYTYGVESPDLAAVDYTVTLGYAYEAGLLETFYELSLEDEELLRSLPDRRIKVVVLTGEPVRRGAVDHTDYEAVKQFYGLAD